MQVTHLRKKSLIDSESLHIQLTWKHLAAFFTLVFLVHELHELSHVLTVRILCGCWGERDFLLWKLCGSCSSDRDYGFTLIGGPVFTYLVMWTGVYLIARSNDAHKRSLGFVLILSALPMARIMGAAVGGGDEVLAMRLLLQEPYHLHTYFARTFSFALVLFMCGIPLLVCYRLISNRFRFLLFIGFALLPVYIDKWVVEGLLNSAIENTSLYRIMGAPPPVFAWLIFLIVMLVLLHRNLFAIGVKPAQP